MMNDEIVTPPSNTTTNTSSSKGCLIFSILSIGCLSLPIIILGISIVLGVTTFNNVKNGIVGIFRPQTTANVVSTETILQSIRPLGQLVSVSAQVAKADIHVGVEQGAFNACGYGANHVAQGTIEAGIDLTQFDETQANYNALDDEYTLTLPAPQLTSCRIDYIRQYNRTTTVCRIDWDEARILANHMAIHDFVNDSLESGILERAERETNLLIDNFVSSLTGSSVSVVFAENSEMTLPSSCKPTAPENWVFDDNKQSWQKVRD